MRKVIFWIHLTAGVLAGLVILVMSATGVLLTYEKQMVAWADRGAAAGATVQGQRRLSVDELMAAASEEGGAPVTALTISSVSDAPALATVGQAVFAVNPYTGTVIGESAPRLRAFFRSVTGWHRWLAVDGAGRQTARLFTGWGNVLFLLIVVGGPFIWFPRKWTAAQFKAVVMFRGGLRGKARDFNWHNVIGIWSFVPLVLIVVSALPMSFPWANNAVYQLVGEAPPALPGQRGGREATSMRQGRPALEPLWAKAEQQVDGWRTISARFGGPGNAPLTFTIDRGTGGQPQLRGTLTVDRSTADVVKWEPFESQPTGRQLRTFLRFAHTGEFFGVIGQTIAGLATAGAVVLVWTGLALALRRVLAWRARRLGAIAATVRRPAA